MVSPSTAAVIGAGPAGGLAATLLARAGWEVTLVEQRRFPRDKVCGECISALGLETFARSGLAAALDDAGAVPLTHFALHPARGDGVRLPLPRPMAGLSRARLDALLLQAARAAGAEIAQPARCEEIVPGRAPAGPTIRLLDLATRSTRVLTPRWALLADGKGAESRTAGEAPVPTGDFGVKAHFEGVVGPRDTIELFAAGGTYGGVAAIEGDRWNAAFSVPAAMLRQAHGDVDALMADLYRASAPLARRLAGARRAIPWLAAPLPRFPVATTWPAGVIPLGNAAAALEPIGGEGIGLALRSAELAAQTLIRDSAPNPAALAYSFRRLWRPRRAACRAAAKFISAGPAASLAADLLRHDPRLSRRVLQWIGK